MQDVLGRHGVVTELENLRQEGRIEYCGFTGLDDVESLSTVVKEGPFVAVQIPLNIPLPIAGVDPSAGSIDVNSLELAGVCNDYSISIIAIRVLAGGALAGQEPSAHTRQTKFFPPDLFQRDRNRATKLAQLLPEDRSCVTAAIRYVTGTLNASTAVTGFSTPAQINEPVAACGDGRLEESLIQQIKNFSNNEAPGNASEWFV